MKQCKINKKNRKLIVVFRELKQIFSQVLKTTKIIIKMLSKKKICYSNLGVGDINISIEICQPSETYTLNFIAVLHSCQVALHRGHKKIIICTRFYALRFKNEWCLSWCDTVSERHAQSAHTNLIEHVSICFIGLEQLIHIRMKMLVFASIKWK